LHATGNRVYELGEANALAGIQVQVNIGETFFGFIFIFMNFNSILKCP
jgi:hypothetical protein